MASEQLDNLQDREKGTVPFSRSCVSPKQVQVAVFDFDGTSISGNSPVLLIKYLVKQRMIKPSVVFRTMLWGAAYKLRLPQNESWVRGLVFRTFSGRPKHEVDAFLYEFYDQVIEERWRKDAEEAMRSHTAQGHVVFIVSATFEPIIERAMQSHPFDHQVSTKMRVDGQGNYTCEVDGKPVEGAEKVAAVGRLADELFGAGGWRLAFAYGDHYSDRPLLYAAEKAYAVTPDNALDRTAASEGWQTLHWK